jgi:tRNA-dependent cyclodipeptide synthase
MEEENISVSLEERTSTDNESVKEIDGREENDENKVEYKHKEYDELIFMGISLYNKYFCVKRLPLLINYLLDYYPKSKIGILVCDIPAKHNYDAIYNINDEKEAEKHAIKSSKGIKRVCRKVLNELKINNINNYNRCFLIDWSYDIMKKDAFIKYNRIIYEKLIPDCNQFVGYVKQQTQLYLKDKIDNNLNKNEQEKALIKAMNYAYEEMACVSALPFIYDNMQHIYVIYHTTWHLLENLCKGNFDYIYPLSNKRLSHIYHYIPLPNEQQ